MPQLFQAANRASLEGQRSYVGTTRFRLVLLAGTALLSLATWRVGAGNIDVIASVGVLAFVIALVLELNLWKGRPDKSWYDGRAVAESAKTLAWKFAVGGKPFPVDGTPLQQYRQELLGRLEKIRIEFSDLELAPIGVPPISQWMIDQRTASFEVRKASYLKARIADQMNWYEGKAKYNKTRANIWRWVLIVLEIVGAVAAFFAALSAGAQQFSPAIAAVVMAVVAWTQTKQHDSNARAYSAAVHDLVNASEKLRLAGTEQSWAIEVDDAEEAISREHVVWWGTRSRI
jgi:hypothetical protein